MYSMQVLLITTVGEFDIELWSKEAPLACRNFVQLCMEGYYDDTIFHRIVKGTSVMSYIAVNDCPVTLHSCHMIA